MAIALGQHQRRSLPMWLEKGGGILAKMWVCVHLPSLGWMIVTCSAIFQKGLVALIVNRQPLKGKRQDSCFGLRLTWKSKAALICLGIEACEKEWAEGLDKWRSFLCIHGSGRRTVYLGFSGHMAQQKNLVFRPSQETWNGTSKIFSLLFSLFSLCVRVPPPVRAMILYKQFWIFLI